MFTAFSAVVPVFLVIALGMVLRGKEILPERSGDILGVYVLKVALPLLIFHILSAARPEDLARGGFWLGIIGSQLIVYALGYFGDKLFCRRGIGPASVSALSCSCCNMAFLGLPIVANMLPGNQEAMIIAGLCTVTPGISMIISQVRLDTAAGAAAWEKARFPVWAFVRLFIFGNPLLLATLGGFVLALTGLGIWTPLDRAVSLVGYTAAPCMLLALGLDLRRKLSLAGRRLHGHVFLWQVWLVGCKLLIQPLLCGGIMLLAGVSGHWLVVGVLMSATATALVVAVIAEVYSAVPEEAALTVVLSNGMSLFTLTGFVWFFQSSGLV